MDRVYYGRCDGAQVRSTMTSSVQNSGELIKTLFCALLAQYAVCVILRRHENCGRQCILSVLPLLFLYMHIKTNDHMPP